MQSLNLTEQADFGVLYDAVSRRLQPEEWQRITQGVMTRDMFIAHCMSQKLPSVGFELDGKPIGGMIFDGKATHLEVLPEYHGRWGLLWPSVLKWMFSLKDPMLVDIDRDNEKCHRFMARNNWRRVKEDEKFVTYEMSSSATPLYAKEARVLKRMRRETANQDQRQDADAPCA
jgi:hypothetical protein